MNGSFIIPARYIKNFSNEKVWIYHSIIGLALIPWLILTWIFPEALHHYLLLQPSILLFLIGSGIIFGLGQVCFSYAIESIGIALSFSINLSIGVTIGSMFVVFDRSIIFTTQGYFVMLSIFLILCSLIIYYYAGKNKEGYKDQLIKASSHYHRGWILASLTGITSGLQNITFIIVAFHATTLFKAGNSFWVWPPFLLAATLPMLIGFLYKIKTKPISNYDYSRDTQPSLKNILLVVIMGLFFTGSLALYSKGMSQLTHPQQVVGWPVFIIAIILASQAWGWLYRESTNTTAKSKANRLVSSLLLITAIIILAFKT